jgi:hypothetical protein
LAEFLRSLSTSFLAGILNTRRYSDMSKRYCNVGGEK